MATFKVSTKANKDAATQATTLTIDWAGCSADTIQQMATQALVVKLQGNWRKNGIPAAVTVKAADHAPGTRTVTIVQPTFDNIVAAVPTMTEEQRSSMIAELLKLNSVKSE